MKISVLANTVVTLDPGRCQARIHTCLWNCKFHGSSWELAVKMSHVFGLYESIVFRLVALIDCERFYFSL